MSSHGRLEAPSISPYKWDEDAIREEYKYQDDSVRPNMSKVLKFQRHSDDMSEVVAWCINSIYNDLDESTRRLDHGTGAS